ncbi:beta-galactosidase domain 4-containing protein [Propionibacteriaceae bacterium G1746]
MVLPDGRPTPGLAEFKAVTTPIKLTIDAGRLVIANRRHDGDTGDLRFVLVDEDAGTPVQQLMLDVPAVPAGGQVAIELPPAPGSTGELWRTVRAELAADAPWAPEGHEVSFVQACLSTPRHSTAPTPQRAPAGVAVVRDGDTLILGPARFNPQTGDLLALAGLPIGGPRLTLWRAPIENDFGRASPSYLDVCPADSAGLGAPGPSTAQRWLDAGLDRLQRRVVAVDAADDALVVRHRYAAAGMAPAVDVTLRYQLDGSWLTLEADAAPTIGWRGVWARLGLHFTLPTSGATAEWFGTGPLENYPDSARAARVGRFAMAIDDLVVDYSVPQESGHRAGLRDLRVPELGLQVEALPVAGERPGFTLRRHDEHEVAAAGHPHELPEPSALHLTLDVAQHGLGSRACGPDVLPAHQLRPRAGAWSLRLRHEDGHDGHHD